MRACLCMRPCIARKKLAHQLSGLCSHLNGEVHALDLNREGHAFIVSRCHWLVEQGERDDAIARALASAAVSDSLAGIPLSYPSYHASRVSFFSSPRVLSF